MLPHRAFRPQISSPPWLLVHRPRCCLDQEQCCFQTDQGCSVRRLEAQEDHGRLEVQAVQRWSLARRPAAHEELVPDCGVVLSAEDVRPWSRRTEQTRRRTKQIRTQRLVLVAAEVEVGEECSQMEPRGLAVAGSEACSRWEREAEMGGWSTVQSQGQFQVRTPAAAAVGVAAAAGAAGHCWSGVEEDLCLVNVSFKSQHEDLWQWSRSPSAGCMLLLFSMVASFSGRSDARSEKGGWWCSFTGCWEIAMMRLEGRREQQIGQRWRIE